MKGRDSPVPAAQHCVSFVVPVVVYRSHSSLVISLMMVSVLHPQIGPFT
jgi:hypothetical protein